MASASSTINLNDVGILDILNVFFPGNDAAATSNKRTLFAFLLEKLACQVGLNRFRNGSDAAGEELVGFNYDAVVDKAVSLGARKFTKPKVFVTDIYKKVKAIPEFENCVAHYVAGFGKVAAMPPACGY